MVSTNNKYKTVYQKAVLLKFKSVWGGVLMLAFMLPVYGDVSPEAIEKAKEICNKAIICYAEVVAGNNQKKIRCNYIKQECEKLLNVKLFPLDSDDYKQSINTPIWPGVWGTAVDATINWGNGKVYFFKKKEYIRFDIAANKADPGYPKAINNSTWPGLWTGGVDAAVNWGNGKVFFFKENQYSQYDISQDRIDSGYPKTIDGLTWPGLWGSSIDAVINWGNGKAYFFKGNQYISFDIAERLIDPGYPKDINDPNGILWSGFLNDGTRNNKQKIVKTTSKNEKKSPQIKVEKNPEPMPVKEVFQPAIKVQPSKILFDGSLGKQWNELAAYGGNFKKFAKIENKVLVVDVPEGNSKGKTGIRSAEALFKIPEKEEKLATKLTFTIDPSRSSAFVLAVIPSDWDGNLEWRSHLIRVGLQKDEENKNSLLRLWIRGSEMMKVNLEPKSIEQLSIVMRPDRLVLVTDRSDNILLQGFLPDNQLIFKKGYRISVLAAPPKKDMSATLALKTITLKQEPYKTTKLENDPTILLDKEEKTVLFDGHILNKRWIKYKGDKGSSFLQNARFVGDALLVDTPKGVGWGKVGIKSTESLVWLDKFGKGAEVRVNFKFNPEKTTGFVVALAAVGTSKGNRPGEPHALLHWRKNRDGNATKISLFLTPNKKWKPLWEQELPNEMPEEVSFVLTPGGIQIEAPGISKDVIPWDLSMPSQSFLIYAYSQSEKYKEPSKMALKQISLERKAGEPILPSKPQKGVALLPVTTLFDGKLNEWWEGAGVGGAEFSKYGRFENNQMIVDVPKKTSSGARAGLLSKKPILDFNERILSTSHKLKIKIDPKQTTGFQMMFHPGKHADMWGQSSKAIISFIRCSKGLCAGKYTLLLRINFNPNYIWSRTVDADWVENSWDGNFTIETGNGWMAVHLSGGPSVRGNSFGIGKKSKLYMTIYSHNEEGYGPAKFALEKITSEWVMPEGMSKMDRFLYVDDDDFDSQAFINEVSAEMDSF